MPICENMTQLNVQGIFYLQRLEWNISISSVLGTSTLDFHSMFAYLLSMKLSPTEAGLFPHYTKPEVIVKLRLYFIVKKEMCLWW